MARKLFGTDGVRGRANVAPMTALDATRLAMAVGQYFSRDDKRHRVVIGKDTRRSGYMLENALTAGFTAAGMDVFALGPIPTPGVGLLTHSMRADLGVMISASHNPYYDNGIKFFGPDGFKLSDAAEEEIEALMEGEPHLAGSDDIGRVTRLNDSAGRYVEYAKTTLPAASRLRDMKVVVDCANGAAYKAAPLTLWELGAEVIPMGVSPNGFNINEGCGSTAPEAAAKLVVEEGADIGICLDGDADRIMVIDETGTIADGDQLMALMALHWAKAGKLNHNTLVATVMSNLGLENHLKDNGITLKRTGVGDRYVVEEMRRGGYNMGGEQSGHIVMTDYATTGDGMVAGLQILAILKEAMRERGAKASEILRCFEPVPQILENVRYDGNSAPLEDAAVKAAIAEGEERLAATGRLLIRKSGTEPLIRVMGESTDEGLLTSVIGDIAGAVRAV